MKLGPRVAVVTTLIMAGVLAASTWAVLRSRRADLVGDLQRKGEGLASALSSSLEPVKPGLEPVKPADAVAGIRARAAELEASGARFTILPAAWEKERPSNAWARLVEEVQAQDAPSDVHLVSHEDGSFYRMAVPLHNTAPGDPQRQIVAVFGLEGDCSYIDEEVVRTAKRMVPVLAVGVLAFGVVIYFLLMSTVVNPLRRLVEAVDAVAKGDISRAVLPERDDEIGSLAGRFNAMTNYLRDARGEEARANAARLALETRLRHSEKLATMGQMAAEIAHEVGTPLNVIGGRARSLAKRPGDPAEVQKNADIIGAQVERITRIIRQVLDFSRKSRPTLTRVDVAKIVSEALEFVAETLRRQRVVATVRPAANLPLIPGDPDELQQVALNLLMNALHAMPQGGRLDFLVDTVIRRKEGLALAAPSPFLMLQISDTGVGVPPADRERIFEAFFTTKDTGEGTGLGLAVAKGIVKDHDGWIEVDDRPQGGAVFRVFLPVGSPTDEDPARTLPPGTPIPPEARAAARAQPTLPKKGGSARID